MLAAAESLPPDADPVLIHGDLTLRHPLVSESGGLAGVIACARAPRPVDLPSYRSLFDDAARGAFRTAYGPLSDATLARARVLAVFFDATLAAYAHDTGMVDLEREALRGLEPSPDDAHTRWWRVTRRTAVRQGRRLAGGSGRHDEADRACVVFLRAQMSVFVVPATGRATVGAALDHRALGVAVDRRPHGLRGPHRRVQQRLRPAPVGLEEAVLAIPWRGDRLHPYIAPEGLCDLLDRGKQRALARDALREVLALPLRHARELQREDDHRATGTRRISASPAATGCQWWIVAHAIEASTASSSRGSASARASMTGAPSGRRCARIVALGSTASTQRSEGS